MAGDKLISNTETIISQCLQIQNVLQDEKVLSTVHFACGNNCSYIKWL